MIYIAICDDEAKSLQTIKLKVQQILEQQNVLFTIHDYSQSILLKYDIEEGKYFDLILCDIEMPDIDGMKLSAYIKDTLPDALTVLITSHIKYAIDAFEISVFRYIPKNEISTRLEPAVLDAVKLIWSRTNRSYQIHTANRIEKISYRNILYISREGKNSVIVLRNNQQTFVRKSLATVMDELDSDDFIFIDRGNIVNLQYIIKVKDDRVELENGVWLYASHTKIQQLKNRISKYWGDKL